MDARWHVVSPLILGLLLWSPRGGAGSPAGQRAPGKDEIRVEIVGLRSDRGMVYCSLYAAPGDGFPAASDKAIRRMSTGIQTGGALCQFDGLPAGVYAAAMIHDENGNRKLDTNWIGIPTEGYGASRDAKGRFGPPRFEDAAFSYSGGSVRVPVQVQY